jgi:hypothetical protein
LVEGWTLTAAAEAAGGSVRCARKWVGRYRLEGEQGLLDRCSAPRRVANRTPEDRVEAIVKLRRLRFTAAEIAETLGMALSTVSGILARLGLGRLGRLGLEPAVRYEHQRPGNVKRLGRIQGGAGKRVRGGLRKHYNPARTDRDGKRRLTVGWEYVHVCVDDYSRLAYAEVLADEKAATAVGFLRRAVSFYATPRHPGRTSPHRQRQPLRLSHPRGLLQDTRHPPQPHPPLPATNQRQSRTLHPHHAQRLGLRRHLPLKQRTHRRP